MNKKEKDEALATRLRGALILHQKMLSDGTRNKLLYEAIKDRVSVETSFLDIGAGTGVWAILAAKLGAKRVVAVEIEECLIPIIYKMAQENGVAGKIEIIHANIDDVKIRGKFDLIVSEVFGSDAFGESTVNTIIKARNKYLAPGGVLIPQKMMMFAVPVKVQNPTQEIPSELPISCNFLKSINLNYSQSFSFSEMERVKFLAEPQKLAELDFENVTSGSHLHRLSAGWKMEDLPEANAFLVFTQSNFTDKLKMDGLESKSWVSGLYEFQTFSQKSGEIIFSLTISSQNSAWTVALSSNPEIKAQSYSSVFGFARLKMSQKQTPHRKFKASKKET